MPRWTAADETPSSPALLARVAVERRGPGHGSLHVLEIDDIRHQGGVGDLKIGLGKSSLSTTVGAALDTSWASLGRRILPAAKAAFAGLVDPDRDCRVQGVQDALPLFQAADRLVLGRLQYGGQVVGIDGRQDRLFRVFELGENL